MITVVVPTIRPESFSVFRDKWYNLFHRHEVHLVVVWDGDSQKVDHWKYSLNDDKPFYISSATASEVMGEDYDLIPKRTAACRNLGFAYTAVFLPETDYIITLDDDVEPWRDTIQDHIDQLGKMVPISWINSAQGMWMRGFPYGVREEAEVWVSHGVWRGVPDLDAVSQLAFGAEHYLEYVRGVVPRGIYMPFCGMNVGFKRAALPYMYYAPVHLLRGAERFDDIWLGIQLVRQLDILNKALVTGYAEVYHRRASNVWKNLQREAVGMEINEACWRDETHPFFKTYADMRFRWKKFIEAALEETK